MRPINVAYTLDYNEGWLRIAMLKAFRHAFDKHRLLMISMAPIIRKHVFSTTISPS